MPKDLVIVVASSNDVAKERDLVDAEIQRINDGLAGELGVRFTVKRYERDGYPDSTRRGPERHL